jgi:uncharacterized MAPEG superfamily protein
MTIELHMLALTVVLGFVHVFLAGHFRTRQYGKAWNVSARDDAMPPLNRTAARLARAQANFFETFPFFAVAVLIAHLAGRTGAITLIGVQLYFWARVAYLPLYVFGVPVIRTLVWSVGTLGIALILIALL